MFELWRKFYSPVDAPSGATPTAPPQDKPSDDPQPPGGDTPTDTPDDPSAPSGDTPSDTPDYGNLMQETGLHKKYGSVEAALRAIPEQQATITRAQQEAAELRNLLTARFGKSPDQPEASISDKEVEETFGVDAGKFRNILDKMGYAKKSEIENLSKSVNQADMRAALNESVSTLRAYPELSDVADFVQKAAKAGNISQFPTGTNKTWDRIIELAQEHGVTRETFGQSLPLLYQVAKGQPSTPTQPAAPQQKRNRAETGGGPGQSQRTDTGMPNFSDRSKFPTAKSIEEWAAKNRPEIIAKN